MSGQTIYITLSQTTVVIPIIAGVTFFKKINKPFKILFWFFVISAFFEIQTNICAKIFHNNMPGLHLFSFIEMLTFSSVYYYHFIEKKILTLLIFINAIIFILVAFANAFVYDGLCFPNTISRSYSSVSLTCYSLIYFYYLFKKDFQYYSWQYPMFWTSIGVLLYFGLNLFYFMLLNYLIKNATFTGYVSTYTHAAINIIANCLFAQSFRCHRNFITK